MDISFCNQRLKATYNSEKKLLRKYGAENARLIGRRMAVLRAAPSLDDVPHQPPDRRHELSQNRKGQFAVDVKHPFRLIFKPYHNPLPMKADGGLDLQRITSVTILGVEDYH